MNKKQLVQQIKEKKSFLCIGLDTDLTKVPEHLLKVEDPIFEFNKEIIDATHDICVAYKPNLAFYEVEGINGMIAFQKTVAYIKENYPNILIIADAKRGDIGNTSKMYAKSFFEKYRADAITVAPYMGEDSIRPFLEYKNKWTILLALTSNEGAKDFQHIVEKDEKFDVPLHINVIAKSKEWGENIMYVVGATQDDYFDIIRSVIPDHFLLIPGIGAQGGNFERVCTHTMNNECGILVNSSRGIIYSSNKENFAIEAKKSAKKLQRKMEVALKTKGII